MPDLNGRELLDEWRRVMDSVVHSAASAAGRPELPGELLEAMQSQMALMQRVVDRERELGGELAGRIIGPVDAVFDLLEESGAMLRREAEALETAGRALEDASGLLKRQAELFAQTIAALREPGELAKAAAGLRRRASRTQARKAEKPTSAPAASGGAAKRSTAKTGAAKRGAAKVPAKRGAAKPRGGAARPKAGTATRRAAKR